MVGQAREGTSDKTGVGRTKDYGAVTVQRKSPGTPCRRARHLCQPQPTRNPAHARPTEWGSVCGGWPGQRVEEQGACASRTRKRSEARCGRPEDGGVWTAKTVKRPLQQPAQPQYANYWAPVTCKRHILPHPLQPQHTNHRAPRMGKRHQQEPWPQRPTESSDPTQQWEMDVRDPPVGASQFSTAPSYSLRSGATDTMGQQRCR